MEELDRPATPARLDTDTHDQFKPRSPARLFCGSRLRAGWAQVWQAIVRQTWISSARARGIAATDPSKGQRRATSIVLITAVLWMILCLLVGLTVGLVG